MPMARANSVPMGERMQGLDVSEPGGPHRGGWMAVGNGLSRVELVPKRRARARHAPTWMSPQGRRRSRGLLTPEATAPDMEAWPPTPTSCSRFDGRRGHL